MRIDVYITTWPYHNISIHQYAYTSIKRYSKKGSKQDKAWGCDCSSLCHTAFRVAFSFENKI